MEFMQLIGLTAAVDAVLSALAWLIVKSRRAQVEREGGAASATVRYFSQYLVFTFIFLALTALAMLRLTGPTQMVVVMISDIALWISLVFFILLAFAGRQSSKRNAALMAFLVFAFLGSLYQVMQYLQSTLTFGPVITYILANMAPLLMYAVWVPSALVFFNAAATARTSLVRTRSLMFAIGLLLITFSWAFRLLAAQPSFLTVSLVSVAGFGLLLGGVIYRAR